MIAEKDEGRDITSAALAIVLLAFSTFIPSLNLDQQADRFRECYLKLQRLNDCVSENDALTAAYYDILDAYPNHPPTDYKDLVVASVFTHQNLTVDGKPLRPTCYMYFGFFIRKLAVALLTVAAVLAPGLLYFIL